MKLLLFLYPLAQFFEEVPVDLSFSFEPGRGPLCRDDLYNIDKIIKARYRTQGYEIAWVFYGQRGKKHLPETSDLAKYVSVLPSDLMISSGSYKGEPNFEFIYEQLPEKIEELVVGGFHWISCVAFTADYAIEAMDLNVHIDEDTTQVYFTKLALTRLNLKRDLELMGETCQPWQLSGIRWEQAYYCEGMMLKPWIVRDPPIDSFTFCLGDELRAYSRAEVEAYLAGKGRL